MKKVLVVAELWFFVLGIVGLVHPDFTYHKAEEVDHVGPISVTVKEEKAAHLPAAVSFLVAGLTKLHSFWSKVGANLMVPEAIPFFE